MTTPTETPTPRCTKEQNRRKTCEESFTEWSARGWQEELNGETSLESIRQIQANAIVGIIPELTGYVLTDRQNLARIAAKIMEGK